MVKTLSFLLSIVVLAASGVSKWTTRCDPLSGTSSKLVLWVRVSNRSNRVVVGALLVRVNLTLCTVLMLARWLRHGETPLWCYVLQWSMTVLLRRVFYVRRPVLATLLSAVRVVV